MIDNKFGKFLVSQIDSRFPAAIFFKETDDRVIALTIDDVPARDEDVKDSTRKILEVIEFHNQAFSTNVNATFFVTTDHVKFNTHQDKLDSEILSDIVAKGHEIGNHGKFDCRHANLSKSHFEAEFSEAHQFLSDQISSPIRWFRPGQAFYNDSMLEILTTVGKDLGYQEKFALASMVPFDTKELLDDPSFTLKNIARFTFPGSILLLHGGLSHQAVNTIEVLKQLLPRLHQQNYQVVSLSQLISS